VHQQSCCVRARYEIGGRHKGAIGNRRKNETCVRSYPVRIRLDRPQLSVGWDFSFEELNQLDLRLRPDLPQVRLEN